jgi:hypothetical protein
MNDVAMENAMMLSNNALDMAMITQNVRDLAQTANFKHMDDLEELHTLALGNLEAKMAPGQPLAEDPALVMQAYKMISGVVMSTVEVKRKAAETLLHARVLMTPDPYDAKVADAEKLPDDEEPEGPDGAIIEEGGMFGEASEVNTVGEDEIVVGSVDELL